MKVVDDLEIEEEIQFARTAAMYFAEHPRAQTFTDGGVKPGCLFAVRWGLSDQAVAVLKLDDFAEPTVYGDLVYRELARKEVEE